MADIFDQGNTSSETSSTGVAPLAPVEAAVVSESAASPTAPSSDSLATATAAPSEVISHTETKTLLETAIEEAAPKITSEEVKTPEEIKPVEEKSSEEKKPEELSPQTDAQKVPVEYAPFELPEGFKFDDAKLAKTKETFNELGLSQEQAQKLINLHSETLQQYHDNSLSEQHRVFGEMRKSWQNEVMSDEQIGGSGHHTAMRAIARMRDMLVPEKDRVAFDTFLSITGAGDHPAFLKLLHNAARRFDEPISPSVPAKPIPQKADGRRGVLYDHPSSNKSR